MITLIRAAQTLHRRFGRGLGAAYLPGKTAFRDALCEASEISQADAEVLCDSLEKGGALAFRRSPESGPGWTIDPSRVTGA